MYIKHLLRDRSKNIVLLMSLYVFFLPLRNNISSVIGILLFLTFFIDNKVNIKSKFNNLFKNKIAVLSILLYLFHIIGLIYTSNFKYAGLDLEIKLPLLILPFFLFSEKKLNSFEIRKIFKFFTLGNLFAMVFCLIVAFISFKNTNVKSVFFYNDLSQFMHPSYFSMLLGFNVIIILNNITAITQNENFDKFKLFLLFILCTFFLIFITLLSSKAGILVLLLCVIIVIIKEIYLRKFYLLIYFSSILSILLVLLFTNQNSITSKRFLDAKKELTSNDKKNSNEKVGSSDSRIEIWKATSEILTHHYLIGIGTGDVKDELVKQYKKNNFTTGVENNYNCHNQYLQFTLIFGIFGSLIFILLLILAIKNGIKEKNAYLLFFIAIIVLNMMMESILESKAGVEFYAFFLPFLINNKSEI